MDNNYKSNVKAVYKIADGYDGNIVKFTMRRTNPLRRRKAMKTYEKMLRPLVPVPEIKKEPYQMAA